MNLNENRRILVIDDNEAIHADFRKIIGADDSQTQAVDAAALDLFDEPLGTVAPSKRFELFSAYQGQEGLEMVDRSLREQNPFAVAFVDVRMPPGWDGIETIQRIWQIDHDLQVVICTAYSDYSRSEIAARLGETDRLLILKKPFDNIEVLQLASALSSKWALLQQSRRSTEDLQQMVSDRTQELRRTNESLRVAEARARAILETVAEGIITIDEQGYVGSANAAAEQMFHYLPGELVGQNIERMFPAAYCDEFSQQVCEDDHRPQYAVIEARRSMDGRKKDGISFPIEVAIRGASACGRHFYTGVVRDLTEQRYLQRQLVQSQKLEAVGLLAGGIAHEFNNSLQVILGFADYAQGGLSPDEDRFQDLQQVIDAAARSATLTRQLLAFSRHQLLEPVRVDPREMLAELAQMLRPLIGKDIDLQLIAPVAAGKLLADPAIIKQVLMNLCLNALDAMPNGGCLILETRPVELSREDCELHQSATPGEYVMFSVTDTGCGMPPEVKERIFEPFFTTKAIGQGTGLGLSMVYGAVQQHQGFILVDSEVGIGATFRVYLPLASKAAKTGTEERVAVLQG
jgi:two-component system, cell cycle sensor histidine kinase and response regulator CckA